MSFIYAFCRHRRRLYYRFISFAAAISFISYRRQLRLIPYAPLFAAFMMMTLFADIDAAFFASLLMPFMPLFLFFDLISSPAFSPFRHDCLPL